MYELKPCPFCGGSNLRVMGGIGKYVKCRDCECSSGHLPGGACSADEHGAVEAWNARWERTCRMSNDDWAGYYGDEYKHLYECDVCGESTALLCCVNENGDTEWVEPKFCGNCGLKAVAE